MHIVTLLLLLAAVIVFGIEAWVTKTLVALGLTLFAAGVLASLLLHGSITV